MKTIDEILKYNRDLFEDKEPMPGHMERFQNKLRQRLHSSKTIKSIVPYLLKAAVVTLLITLSSLWTWEHFIRKDSAMMSLGEVSPQYREVENYYMHQVNLMEDEIVSIDFNNNPKQKDLLLTEMKSMDSSYIQLQKELRANPDDERIINAMIEHYQTKVEVMTFILSQLKSIRNEHTNTIENEKVNL